MARTIKGTRTLKVHLRSLLFQSRGRVTTRTPFCLRVRPRRGRTTADGGSRQIGQIVQRAAEASDRSDKIESAIRNHESGLTQREANVKKRNRDGRPREEMYGFDEEERNSEWWSRASDRADLLYSSANSANTESNRKAPWFYRRETRKFRIESYERALSDSRLDFDEWKNVRLYSRICTEPWSRFPTLEGKTRRDGEGVKG